MELPVAFPAADAPFTSVLDEHEEYLLGKGESPVDGDETPDDIKEGNVGGIANVLKKLDT